MRKLVVTICAGLFVAAAAAPARAHHAFAAEFDAKQPVKFEKAVVTKMEWTNPHTWIHVDVTMPDGRKEAWAIEAGTPNVLFRRGFTKDALKPGTAIVIDGYRAKDGSRVMVAMRASLPTGKILLGAGAGDGAQGTAGQNQ